MEFIVDVQGFKKPNNDFVFKELAILPLQLDAQPLVFLFEPPCAWNTLPGRYKSENRWLTHNYHGIDWAAGDVPYDEVPSLLQGILRGASAIYAKGLEKKTWLEKYVLNVENLEDFNCPSLKKLDTKLLNVCKHHTIHCENCAAKNVKILQEWFLEPSNRYISAAVKGIDEVDSTFTTTLHSFFENYESFL